MGSRWVEGQRWSRREDGTQDMHKLTRNKMDVFAVYNEDAGRRGGGGENSQVGLRGGWAPASCLLCVSLFREHIVFFFRSKHRSGLRCPAPVAIGGRNSGAACRHGPAAEIPRATSCAHGSQDSAESSKMLSPLDCQGATWGSNLASF